MNDVQSTKTDLQAIKAYIQKITETVTRMEIDLAKIQEDLRDMQENMATKTDVNRIMNAIDSYATQVLSYNNIEDHEKRLVVLESKK